MVSADVLNRFCVRRLSAKSDSLSASVFVTHLFASILLMLWLLKTFSGVVALAGWLVFSVFVAAGFFVFRRFLVHRWVDRNTVRVPVGVGVWPVFDYDMFEFVDLVVTPAVEGSIVRLPTDSLVSQVQFGFRQPSS